jgi:hypothetical protein
MIMDERNEFADAVSVIGAAGTALIGDVIDLGPNQRDIGEGKTVYFVITVDTEIITAGTAGTIAFQLVSDAQPAIATDGSATVHVASRAFVTGTAAANSSELNAGASTFVVGLPSEGPAYERYLGVLAVVGTTATTAGKINAFLTLVPKGWDAYPEGVN